MSAATMEKRARVARSMPPSCKPAKTAPASNTTDWLGFAFSRIDMAAAVCAVFCRSFGDLPEEERAGDETCARMLDEAKKLLDDCVGTFDTIVGMGEQTPDWMFRIYSGAALLDGMKKMVDSDDCQFTCSYLLYVNYIALVIELCDKALSELRAIEGAAP